jgi:AcrR family transcriptional regulator
MTITPWGEASSLKERRLRPGPGVPREEVERNQRERLFGATVAVVANKGYADSSISDLIKVAGVSRTTFYKYFADKEECFLATLDELLAVALMATEQPVMLKGSLRARAEQGLSIFIGLLVAQPDAARICVVEAYAAGPRALRRVDWAMERCADLIAFVFEQTDDQKGMPREIIDAMVGAVRKMMHTRLQRRTESELVDMVPDLLRLAFALKPPPKPLRDNWTRRGAELEIRELDSLDTAERIEVATMAVIARRGYLDAPIAEIASEAGVSLSTFYGHFESKAKAFEAGVYRRRLQMSAAVLPAYRAARSWPEGIRAITLASLIFLEAEPDFARLITVDVYSAGAAAQEHRDVSIESTQKFVVDSPEYEKLGIPLAAEAIQSATYAILSTRVRDGKGQSLRAAAPLITYVILAPFIGPENAWAVASGRGADGA